MQRRRIQSMQRARSFWLSASNYYMLTAAIALAAFFLVMGVLREEGDEPIIPAGIASSVVLLAAVIIRRSILKKLNMRAHAARMLERNLLALRANPVSPENKLTIEKNASILRELKRKSDAANILAKYAEGHREVFELCAQYIEINTREMPTVNPGSPRIAALRRGREIAEDLHRRHMLRWAEIESTSMLDEAQASGRRTEKIELARRARIVIEAASGKYPSEKKLVDSAAAIDELILKLKVTDFLDKADRARGRGNISLARRHFKAALAEIENGRSNPAELTAVADRIKGELESLSGAE